MGPDELGTALRGEVALRGIRLLVLHGSRARGDAHPGSDWDLAFRADADVDPGDVAEAVVRLTGSEAVDVVDLDRAGALLRFRAARDGVLLAGSPDEFLEFREQAVLHWCDAGPVIRAALRDVLDSLDRPGAA